MNGLAQSETVVRCWDYPDYCTMCDGGQPKTPNGPRGGQRPKPPFEHDSDCPWLLATDYQQADLSVSSSKRVAVEE